MCYLNYPTIVNNIPKDKNKYNNTMEDFALMDNILSQSQTDIGESSNLAQVAQSYACNFDNPKYSPEFIKDIDNTLTYINDMKNKGININIK